MKLGNLVRVTWWGLSHADPQKGKVGIVISLETHPTPAVRIMWPDQTIDLREACYLEIVNEAT